MVGSFEKAVKGGTKIKLAAPKSKYVEHILVATHAGEAGVAEIFRALQNRLRDSTWTIVFKSLIIIHLMIREGEPDVTLKFIAQNPRKLAISNFSEVQQQGRNIRHYADFILERARTYKETRVDFVRNGEGRLKRLSVDKGLLRETEAVQNQIVALLACDVLSNEPDNEITLTAFRLLVTDLLALFYVMNEGVINILEHFFEMSKYDAERALAIYKTFSKQTHQVVEYLHVARQFEHATRLEVPRLKHAPTSLTGSLEEYTHDPDFEINRRQYIAQLDAKKGRAGLKGSSKPFPTSAAKATTSSRVANGKDFPSPKAAAATPAAPAKQEAKGPAPDLIDFFESIEQNQQPMAQSVSQSQQQQQQYLQQPGQMPQPTGQFQQQQQPQQFGQADTLGQLPNFGSQQTGQMQQPQQAYNSPFSQPGYASYNQPTQQQQANTLQPNFTGAGFGGYTPQPQSNTPQQNSLSSIPQNGVATFDTGFQQQQQQHQQLQPNGLTTLTTGQQPQTTNPFRQSMLPTGASSIAGMTSPPTTSTPPTTSPLNRQNTNPFARSVSQPTSPPDQQPANNSMFNSTSSLPTSAKFMAPQQPEQKTLVPQGTGTNPFARAVQPQPHPQLQQQQQPEQQATPSLVANPTGSTNPFRQSMFVNQQTGQGWQAGQGTMGGLEQLPTVAVFPRPGEPQGTQANGQHTGPAQGMGWS